MLQNNTGPSEKAASVTQKRFAAWNLPTTVMGAHARCFSHLANTIFLTAAQGAREWLLFARADKRRRHIKERMVLTLQEESALRGLHSHWKAASERASAAAWSQLIGQPAHAIHSLATTSAAAALLRSPAFEHNVTLCVSPDAFGCPNRLMTAILIAALAGACLSVPKPSFKADSQTHVAHFDCRSVQQNYTIIMLRTRCDGLEPLRKFQRARMKQADLLMNNYRLRLFVLQCGKYPGQRLKGAKWKLSFFLINNVSLQHQQFQKNIIIGRFILFLGWIAW